MVRSISLATYMAVRTSCKRLLTELGYRVDWSDAAMIDR